MMILYQKISINKELKENSTYINVIKVFICEEYKGLNACVKLREAAIKDLNPNLMSKDGSFYICFRFQKKVNNRQFDFGTFETPRGIPENLKKKLQEKCKYKDTIFSDVQ